MDLSIPTAGRRRRVLGRAVAGLAGLSMLAFAGAGHAAAATVCPTSTTAALSSQASTQNACWHPFAATSPFNTALPTGPKLAVDNTAVQQHMATYDWTLNGSSTSFSLDTSNATRPVYFATPSDPVMTINCKAIYGSTSCQGSDGVNTNGARIHVPAGAKPTNNFDGHMTIVETDSGNEYDLWHATISGQTITADTGAEMNVINSDGTADGGDAASFALTAGLLRPSELASGHIDHALVISLPCTNANGANVGYSWPAWGGWGETCGWYWNETTTGAPNLGALFKLNMTDAQIAASGAPTWEKTIMTALAHYGAYGEDTNGSWHNETMAILMQDPTSFTNLNQTDQWAQTFAAFGGQSNYLGSSVPIPTSKLVVVDPCVVRGTCPTASTNNPEPPVTTTPVTTTTATTTAPVTTTTTTTPTTATTPTTVTAPVATTTTTAPVTTPTTATTPTTTVTAPVATTTTTAPVTETPKATTTAPKTTSVPSTTTRRTRRHRLHQARATRLSHTRGHKASARTRRITRRR